MHTHIGKLAYILGSNYKSVPCLKKIRGSIQFIIYLSVIRNFDTSKVQYGNEQYFFQSPEYHRENIIYSFHISNHRLVLPFSTAC